MNHTASRTALSQRPGPLRMSSSGSLTFFSVMTFSRSPRCNASSSLARVALLARQQTRCLGQALSSDYELLLGQRRAAAYTTRW